MNKLYFIAHPSDIFIKEKIDEICNEWNYSKSDMKTLTQWKIGCASENTFFSKPFVLLDLRNKSDFAAFKNLIDDDEKSYKKNSKIKYHIFEDDWFGNGVIIITNENNHLDKITKLITKFNGTNIVKQGLKEIKPVLLKELGLNSNLTSFVGEYVGLDYDKIILIKNAISNLTPTQKKNLTEEQIITYLPSQKGEIEPWNVINKLVACDKTVFNEFDRCIENTHPLVLLTLIKNKFRLYFINNLLLQERFAIKDILNVLGLKNNFSIKDFNFNVNLQTLEYINKEIYKTEFKCKDGSNSFLKPEMLVRNLISKILIALQNNRPN